MTLEQRDEYTQRWAQALWDSQIKAGMCSTVQPLVCEGSMQPLTLLLLLTLQISLMTNVPG